MIDGRLVGGFKKTQNLDRLEDISNYLSTFILISFKYSFFPGNSALIFLLNIESNAVKNIYFFANTEF